MTCPPFFGKVPFMKDVCAVILAAGEGTRMRSDRAKVLHEIAGVPMIRYVVQTALDAVNHVVVVVGHQAEAVREVLIGYPMLRFAVQMEQLGTGHAVMCAMPEIPMGIQDVVAKSVGTSNPHNMIKAAFDGLKRNQSPRSVAQRRGKKVSDILGDRRGAAAEAVE